MEWNVKAYRRKYKTSFTFRVFLNNFAIGNTGNNIIDRYAVFECLYQGMVCYTELTSINLIPDLLNIHMLKMPLRKEH